MGMIIISVVDMIFDIDNFVYVCFVYDIEVRLMD